MENELNMAGMKKLIRFTDGFANDKDENPLNIIANQLTNRLKITDPIDYLDINCLFSELVTVVAKSLLEEKAIKKVPDEILLKRIKASESYKTASVNTNIPDNTITFFIQKAKGKLLDLPEIKVNFSTN